MAGGLTESRFITLTSELGPNVVRIFRSLKRQNAVFHDKTSVTRVFAAFCLCQAQWNYNGNQGKQFYVYSYKNGRLIISDLCHPSRKTKYDKDHQR